VALVSQIIDSLDASEALERQTKLYRLKNAQAQDVATAIRNFLDQERQRVTQVLGAEAVGTAQRLLEREIAVVAEPQSNTLLLSASPRYFTEIAKLIEDLDQPQPQVLIQVLVAEVSLDSALDLGLEWTYNGVPFAAGIEISEAKWIESGFSSAVTGGDYSFLFRMLEDKGRLEVLSRPQIVTADNKPAVINIGQNIPLITDSRVTAQGDTINSFRYENVGVNFRVTPRIAPDGFVKLEVGTTNSTISSSTVQINRNAEVPIINQRIANTTVSVQSGQSILIGGLIGTLDDKRVRKVPYLGDIPGLGWFFRSNRNRQERRELLILLTPQILTQPDAILAKKIGDKEMTEDALRKSRIKDEIKRDEVQKQILDPIFPANGFESAPLPKPEVKEIPK
jgi:type II secretion system protein D